MGCARSNPDTDCAGVPLLQGSELLGVIAVNRHEVRLFSDSSGRLARRIVNDSRAPGVVVYRDS